MRLQDRRNDAIAQVRNWFEEDAFELYCQPIAALGGLVMTYPMGEVFIRLREEEDALRAPGEFLPVLESFGMMPTLDRWVVQTVLRHMANGSRIARFSINVSRQTVADTKFAHFLSHELLECGICGESLLFEIDEADALADRQATARFAAMVRSLGPAIVIDGFGRAGDCGDLLAMGGFELIKLNGTLTQQIVANAPDMRWRMLLSELPRMGLRLVAERVEDTNDIQPLRAMNVDYAQGFALYRPQSITHFAGPVALQAA
jgi:EAL domain-containing protein (putative c-di-GMP-specific phosphodiesterase class I)